MVVWYHDVRRKQNFKRLQQRKCVTYGTTNLILGVQARELEQFQLDSESRQSVAARGDDKYFLNLIN